MRIRASSPTGSVLVMVVWVITLLSMLTAALGSQTAAALSLTTRFDRRLRAAYLARMVGRRLWVLVESKADQRSDHLVGTACRYLPVQLAGDESLIGQLVDVTVEDVQPDGVLRAVRCSV